LYSLKITGVTELGGL